MENRTCLECQYLNLEENECEIFSFWEKISCKEKYFLAVKCRYFSQKIKICEKCGQRPPERNGLCLWCIGIEAVHQEKKKGPYVIGL